MSEMNDIYWALQAAKASNESLGSWVRGADARDLVRGRAASIDQGIAAYQRLSAQLRDGRKHLEMPEDFKRTSCGCSDPGAMPPCSWCTDPARAEDDEASDLSPTTQKATS